jgi:hypothetical protein
MFSKIHSCGALLALVGCCVGGCVDSGGLAVGDDGQQALSVVFEGVTYSPREFAALGVTAPRLVSTVESTRTGLVYAFATATERDAYVARMPKPELVLSFNRNNSKFYEDPSYDKKLLEVGVGESVLNLGTHPCNCNQKISSIKASQDARWTKVYDAIDLNPDFGEWWIASGAEISDLALFNQGNETADDDDVTWVNDISSIQVTN